MLAALRTLLTKWFQSPPKAIETAAPEQKPSIPEFLLAHREVEEPPSHPVPYDENLLERARTQWQFGDWQSLAQLGRDTLQHHPDRAKLALLAAAGRLQTGQDAEAKAYIRLAQDWGVSKKLISQVLIAGVHNNLGRAAAVANDDCRAVQHFEDAIRLVAPSTDVALLGHARTVHELTDMGLLPQAHNKVAQLHHQLHQPERKTAHLKVLDMEVDILRDRVYSLKKQFDQNKVSNPIIGRFTSAPTESNPIREIEKQADTEKTYYGLHGLDKKLEAYLDYNNGYFVELGANDGINQSNTYYFEKERGWNGLLIEPVQHNFLKCKANRSPNNAFACAACVSFEYQKPTVKLIYSNLMTTALDLETDLPSPEAHARSGIVYLDQGETVDEIQAPAKTLTALLDEANAPRHIDLLSLDVEGAELEVLKGIDFDNYHFNYLLIECRSEQTLKDFLATHGYTCIDKLSSHDYLYAPSGNT